jgi:hypothetical protein
MHSADQLASLLANVSTWAYPLLWLALGVFAWVKNRRAAGSLFTVAGASSIFFVLLFSDGSAFTRNWETDSPLNVTFEYQPLGFVLANGLPVLVNLLPIVGTLLLLKHSEA